MTYAHKERQFNGWIGDARLAIIRITNKSQKVHIFLGKGKPSFQLLDNLTPKCSGGGSFKRHTKGENRLKRGLN